MKFPSMPRKGIPVETTVREMIAWMRATQITSVVGGMVKTSPGGTILEFRPGKGGISTTSAGITLPFEISVTADSLIAAAGTINGDSHAQEVNTTMTNATWYFRAKVVISATSGAISSTDVLWATSEAANTSTDFYKTIAEVDVVLGVPDANTIVQYTYGPMLVAQYGTPTDAWAVTIF